ncbi:hypothetical protein Celaphus_00018054 [Cervus elaphus hippelaphus]|uniref:Uncharacterized protein n=1 Tax=Cervus elaphus hippelaphus TaxID=46360 RepID=A0A212C8D5_CEREH|nr:hypothetical protein Celaphus_00018054 [Cervus elaphus hippelaphus]
MWDHVLGYLREAPGPEGRWETEHRSRRAGLLARGLRASKARMSPRGKSFPAAPYSPAGSASDVNRHLDKHKGCSVKSHFYEETYLCFLKCHFGVWSSQCPELQKGLPLNTPALRTPLSTGNQFLKETPLKMPVNSTGTEKLITGVISPERRCRSVELNLNQVHVEETPKRKGTKVFGSLEKGLDKVITVLTRSKRKGSVKDGPRRLKRPAEDILYEAAERGPVKHSELVLRPAILQLPQAQGYIKVRKSFGHNVLESCKVKEKNKSKIYEGNSYLLSENLPSARISIQLSTNQNALGTTSLQCQRNEDKYSMKSCSSDFVFGENMVERVLGTQKLTQPQLESDSYIKEKPFKFTLKIPINSPNSRTDTIENISLIESATAFSFKPSPKCLLEKIDVITGEEAEHNVLEVFMRNQGSLRLILNSKLWAQMQIQRANHKNLQITATDLEDYNVKVFLIQASAKDTGRLHAAIHHRLVALRSFDKQTDANQTESQSETVLQQLNYDSCDEDEEDLIQATKTRSGGPTDSRLPVHEYCYEHDNIYKENTSDLSVTMSTVPKSPFLLLPPSLFHIPKPDQ